MRTVVSAAPSQALADAPHLDASAPDAPHYDASATDAQGDRMSTARTARRAATVGAIALGLLLAAGPAYAELRNPLAPQEGAEESADITTGQALLLFGLLPLTILLVVAAIVWLPGAVRNGRYRPNRGWSAAPVWFAGPEDPVAAVETAHVGGSVRGGASGDW